jgi:hypothetical protein
MFEEHQDLLDLYVLQVLKAFVGIQNHDFENGGRQWKC